MICIVFLSNATGAFIATLAVNNLQSKTTPLQYSLLSWTFLKRPFTNGPFHTYTCVERSISEGPL